MSNQTIFGENVEQMSVVKLFENKNDPSCVEELVRRYISRVWKKAVEAAQNREEYEELYSCLLEVLMKCIRNWEGSEEQRKVYHAFTTYLYLKIDSFLRSNWKVWTRNETQRKEELYSHVSSNDVKALGGALDPDDILVIDDAKEALYWGLAQLKERYCKVVVIRYFYGKSLEETSKIIGVTKERIRQIEAKSMRILRSRFGKKNMRLEDYILG